MRAAIVVGDDFDILVVVSPVQLVLDAKVGKVDPVIEVGQVVVARPSSNFVVVAIGRPSLSGRWRLCSWRNC